MNVIIKINNFMNILNKLINLVSRRFKNIFLFALLGP